MELADQWRIPLDVCSQCSGIWFDAGEFSDYLTRAVALRLQGDAPERFVPHREAEKLFCPSCRRSSLWSGESRGLSVYACSRCRGVFLPAPAVATLLAAPRRAVEGPSDDMDRDIERLETLLDTCADVAEAIGDYVDS